MIKTKHGETHLEGDISGLMADYTTITKALVVAFTDSGMNEDEAWEKVKHAADTAKLSKEELKRKNFEKIMQMLFGFTGEDEPAK